MFGHPTFSTIPASCTTKSQSLHHCSAPASLLFELPQVHAYLPCWTAGAGEAYIKRLLSSPWDAGITCCNNFIPLGVSLTNPNLRYLCIDNNTKNITLDICAPHVTHLELHGNLRTDYVLKDVPSLTEATLDSMKLSLQAMRLRPSWFWRTSFPLFLLPLESLFLVPFYRYLNIFLLYFMLVQELWCNNHLQITG